MDTEETGSALWACQWMRGAGGSELTETEETAVLKEPADEKLQE